MKQFTSISGFAAAQVTSADMPVFLQQVTKSGVTLYRIQQKDWLTAYLWVRRKDIAKLTDVANKHAVEMFLVKRTGLYWILISLLRRPIIVIGIALILLLSWYLPTRVLFIMVEGNEAIPTNLILEKAAQCGITFGANRREVRSEKMKNYLLAALPELQWTGINTFGCTAVISVTEKTERDERANNSGVSSIVAERDGVIFSCTVTSGNPVCVEGQAVQAGDILVSGYTDCGIKIQATRASAEIYAQTIRQLTVKTPMDYTPKGAVCQVKEKYSLILGKKRINFSKDSGISPSGCDKMYLQYYCVLPGGFQLPISIVVEQCYYRNADPVITASEATQLCTEDFARVYLTQQMLSGKILGKFEHEEFGDAVYTRTGRYICLEMIGRERSEEIIKHNGESD